MIACPGCGHERPASGRGYDRKFNASAERWSVFEEVLAAEFGNAVLLGQVHQMTVDAYAVRHAGGRHTDRVRRRAAEVWRIRAPHHEVARGLVG